VEKPLDAFAQGNTTKLGCSNYCKDCNNWARRSEKSKQEELDRLDLQTRGFKRCAACKQAKPFAEFPIRKKNSDGLHSYCKECNKIYAREFARTPKQKAKKKEKESQPEFLEKLSEYRKNSDKYQAYVKEYRKSEAYINYTDKRRAEGKFIETNRQWRKNNVERAQQYFRDYYHNKVKKDVNACIARRFRSRLRAALASQNIEKDFHTLDIIGCSITFFRQYFESLFVDDMTWEKVLNGEIHIDHIIPCAYFNLKKEEEKRECFHWTNLQPLWAKDNFSKGSLYNGKRYYKK
jgi:hypothetical protein